MTNVFRFRVLVDHEDTVFRDIEIKGNQTFHDLHLAIQKAFAFDNSQMASFFMSNENWDKGQEITLMEMPFDDGSNSITMSSTAISEMILETGQKVLYVFDFMLMWCFYVDTVAIVPLDKKSKYPKCILEFGEAPDQYSKEIVMSPEDEALLLKNKGKNKFSEEDFITEDDDELEDKDGDIFDDFDDFDNLK